MGHIITELGHPSDPTTDLMDEEITSLQALQGALDIMESPLFSAIVDIRDQCKKVLQWHTQQILPVTKMSEYKNLSDLYA